MSEISRCWGSVSDALDRPAAYPFGLEAVPAGVGDDVGVGGISGRSVGVLAGDEHERGGCGDARLVLHGGGDRVGSLVFEVREDDFGCCGGVDGDARGQDLFVRGRSRVVCDEQIGALDGVFRSDGDIYGVAVDADVEQFYPGCFTGKFESGILARIVVGAGEAYDGECAHEEHAKGECLHSVLIF